MAVADVLSFSPPNPTTVLSSSLEDKFGGKGIAFTTPGTVELSVRNCSSLSLCLSDVVVTFYKPKVSCKDGGGGFEGLLCIVDGEEDKGVKGRVGLVLNEVGVGGKEGGHSVPCFFSNWVVKDVDSDSIDAVQTESPSFLDSLFYSGGDYSKKNDSWTVEDNIYTMLRGKLSKVYTALPAEQLKRIYRTPLSIYETIDQKSGLGFRVIRMGYEDIYLFSTGSLSEKYGKDNFICTGPYCGAPTW